MPIVLATTDDEIQACYPVMAQLRPHISPSDFVPRVRRQEDDGYHLAALIVDDRVVACAGYRFGESLASGRHLYVDDLVTDAGARSHGRGEELFAWLVDQAMRAACDHLLLDSGVQRFAAHRFYLRRRMEIRSFHFVLPLVE